MKATVTGKGRVTIPKKVREALGLGPGDEPEFVVQCDRAAIYPRRRYRAAASSARCGEAGRPLRAVRRRRPTSCGACTATCGPWTFWDGDRVLRALELMASRDVDFDDAYLALWAAERGGGAASFDGDFARLPVRRREP